jgi:DNA-directed RNA polymerase specialized sigma24 family protein
MKGMIRFDFKANRNRSIVLQHIRQQLYPEKEFPKNLFPDLPSVLFNCFSDVIRSREDLRKVYRQPMETGRLEKLVHDILVFKNLLENHPQTVVLIYRTYIKKFIKYRHPHTDEWEDIFQEVMTRLISGKIYRIREKFDFSYQYQDSSKKEVASPTDNDVGKGKKISFFTSYLMVTVRNIYMDIIRERKVRPLTSGEFQTMNETIDVYEDKQMLSRLVINEEFQRFQTVLALYYKSSPRLELCLKLKCRVPLTEHDIHRCFPGCSNDELKALEQDFKGLRDKKLFDIVAPIFNRNERTENKSDTLRKWVSIKVDEITAHLNQTHGCEVYNSKNFVDFVSLYYQRNNVDQVKAIRNPGQSPRR